MSEFKEDKLKVTFMEGTTAREPIIPRIYTLTHSDATGDLFLSIGSRVDYEGITAMRDEVIGEWIPRHNEYVLKIDLHVDGAMGVINSAIREGIFRKELPLALKAIVYGDRVIILENEELQNAPVEVHFNSKYSKLNNVEYWGRVRDYMKKENREEDGVECFRVFNSFE